MFKLATDRQGSTPVCGHVRNRLFYKLKYLCLPNSAKRILLHLVRGARGAPPGAPGQVGQGAQGPQGPHGGHGAPQGAAQGAAEGGAAHSVEPGVAVAGEVGQEVRAEPTSDIDTQGLRQGTKGRRGRTLQSNN